MLFPRIWRDMRSLRKAGSSSRMEQEMKNRKQFSIANRSLQTSAIRRLTLSHPRDEIIQRLHIARCFTKREYRKSNRR